MIEAKAPTGDTVVDYDRTHLALYAALLDAADAGRCWRDAATALMGIDIADPRAEACWRSHLDRARWIVGDGLGPALIASGIRSCGTAKQSGLYASSARATAPSTLRLSSRLPRPPVRGSITHTGPATH